MKWSLIRRGLIRGNFLGIDSLQGILECATWYAGPGSPGGSVVFCASRDDAQQPDSLLATICRLEDEGFLQAIWGPEDEGGVIQLESLTLTVAGHKLLAELREKTAAGRLKRRLSDLLWIIVVSILTTLATLQVKGD